MEQITDHVANALALALSVHAAVTSNTYAIYGHGQEKELTELVPGILNQLGPDSLASLRKMAESYNAGRAMGGGKEKEPEDDDDGVPDLVESFEVDEKAGETAPADSSASKLEEVGSLDYDMRNWLQGAY